MHIFVVLLHNQFQPIENEPNPMGGKLNPSLK